jgi:protein-disulfide isomerase
LLALGSAGAACAQAGADAPLATIDGKPISQADVEASVSAQLKQMEREYASNRAKVLEGALQQVIQDRLIEAEAAARGISKDELLAQIKPAEVTDADVDAFYEQNKAQIPRPKEQVAAQIKSYLEQQGQGAARQKLIDELKQKHAVKVLLEPERIAVAATGPSKGPAAAPVTIVEFSDFQCPACGRAFPTLKRVLQQYEGKVRLVFRDFPLDMHPQAPKAAEAARCAGEQGKFWEMHDRLFTNQRALQIPDLKRHATELGLDAASFDSCIDSGKHAASWKADMDAGRKLGVGATPTFFVNGRLLNGAMPFQAFSEVIDQELARAGAPGK